MSMTDAWLLAMALFCFLFLRNQVAYRLSMEALTRVSVLARDDIKNGRDWRRWHDLYDQVSYDSVLLRFWIWRVEQAYPWLKAGHSE